MLGVAGALKPAADTECSPWSAWITVGTEHTPGFSAYFNRGIVAAQWLARRLAQEQQSPKQALTEIISTPNDPTRAFLGGTARTALLQLLADIKQQDTVPTLPSTN